MSAKMFSAYERNLIVNSRELIYKGIFRVEDLFATINQAIAARGYTKREKKTEEIVTEQGRRTFVELRPHKKRTDYADFVLKIRLILNNVTEVVEEVNGVKQKFHNGDVKLIFDAWLLTDYEDYWGMKPFVYFLKGIINKYIYTFPLEAGFSGEVAGDTAYVYARVRKLLNSYRQQVSEQAKEEEVMQAIAHEIEQIEPAENTTETAEGKSQETQKGDINERNNE